jgi:hypothetical protein
LIEDGSTDPLVIALNLQTLPDYENYKQIADDCRKAMKDVVEIYEPRQQVLVIQWCQGTELALSQALWQMRRQKHTNQDMISFGRGLCHVSQFQDVGRPVAVPHDCLHACVPCSYNSDTAQTLHIQLRYANDRGCGITLDLSRGGTRSRSPPSAASRR